MKSKKKFERSFKEKTDEQLKHTAPEITHANPTQSTIQTAPVANESTKQETEITEELTLITGGCHEDGCTYVFKDKNQKELISSEVPENVFEYYNTEEGGAVVTDKYLNKKYSVTYKMGIVHHEASNSDNEEMIILNIK